MALAVNTFLWLRLNPLEYGFSGIEAYICTGYLCYILCLLHFTAPVCFNTTGCEEEPVSYDHMSFAHCCFELSGISYASAGQCLLCPTSGIDIKYRHLACL